MKNERQNKVFFDALSFSAGPVVCGHGRAAGNQPQKFGRKPVSGLKMKLALMFSSIYILTSMACPMFSASAAEIKSRAAVVMDSATGRVLYAKNQGLRLLPASTTKLVTAMVTLDKAGLKDIVTISRRAAATAPTSSGFRAGDKVTVETLLYAALMKSANDAAVALAEAVAGTESEFVVMMNRKAAAIGADNTKFVNPHGLPGKNQYTTAYDLARIMRHAMRYPLLKEIIGTRITELSTQTGKTVFIRNTNKLLWSDEDILGGKTGYTRKARHCFVCAGERDNDTIIVAILGAPSRKFLWKEAEILMDFGSRVMKAEEEPFVYFTQKGGAPAKARRVLYTAGTKHLPDNVSSARAGRVIVASPGEEKKAVYAAAKMKQTKVTMDTDFNTKKIADKTTAKHLSYGNKTRKPDIERQGDNGDKE
jgi:D-alanyl-D-alanine carboxypeptidase (penicillin-binding protein 5/6)